MRPIKLIMQAFGPYTEKVEIDFTEFENDDIFLISGSTGSGKTSIFDAISFALYGTPTGNIRDATMLRNISAKNDVETFVRFIFDYQGIEYEVYRKPRYMRKKVHGDGETNDPAKAEIKSSQKDIISGVNLVDEEILSILKINQDQFSQIVMIAQNDFLKFLKSNTSERKNILRTIFRTDFYAEFEKELKVLTNIKKDELKQLEYEYMTNVKNLKLEKLDNYTHYDHQKIMQIVKENTSNSSKTQTELANSIKQISSQEKTLNNKLVLLKKNNETVRKYIEIKEVYDKLILKEPLIIKDKQLIKLLNIIKQDIISIDKQYVTSKDELDKSNKTLKDLTISINDTTEKIYSSLKVVSENEKLTADVLELEVKLSNLIKLRPTYSTVNELKDEIDSLNEKVESSNNSIIKRLYKQKLSVNEFLDDYQKDLKTFNHSNQLFNELFIQFNELQSNFLSNQAGLLASKLISDEPCPVCGSIHHPKKATLLSDNIESEYFRVKALYEKSQNDIQVQRDNLEKLKIVCDSNLKLYTENSIKAYKEVFDDIKLKELSEKVSTYDHDSSIDQLIDQKQNSEKLSSELQAKLKVLLADLVYSSLSKLNAEIDDMSTKITKLNKAIKNSLETHQELLSLKLKYETKYKSVFDLTNSQSLKVSELEAELNEIILKNFKNKDEYVACRKLLSKLDSLEEKVDSYDSELLQTKALYDEYKDLSKDYKFEDTKVIEDELLKTEISLKENTEKMSQVINDNLRINEYSSNLSKVYTNIEKVDLELKDYIILSDTASGSLSQKEKIQFETYAQMAYFERILHFANLRLKVMSNNQYELIRKQAASNMRSQGGLELDIFDYYNGLSRDVGSLSGGELFNASLALALGLSDVIQHVSGGIQIDALFIDEGFGTLSDEYLDNAIQTLVEVAGNNRMIGVISHVKELKDAISTQVQITKDKEGSKVKIVRD